MKRLKIILFIVFGVPIAILTLVSSTVFAFSTLGVVGAIASFIVVFFTLVAITQLIIVR